MPGVVGRRVPGVSKRQPVDHQPREPRHYEDATAGKEAPFGPCLCRAVEPQIHDESPEPGGHQPDREGVCTEPEADDEAAYGPAKWRVYEL